MSIEGKLLVTIPVMRWIAEVPHSLIAVSQRARMMKRVHLPAHLAPMTRRATFHQLQQRRCSGACVPQRMQTTSCSCSCTSRRCACQTECTTVICELLHCGASVRALEQQEIVCMLVVESQAHAGQGMRILADCSSTVVAVAHYARERYAGGAHQGFITGCSSRC